MVTKEMSRLIQSMTFSIKAKLLAVWCLECVSTLFQEERRSVIIHLREEIVPAHKAGKGYKAISK